MGCVAIHLEQRYVARGMSIILINRDRESEKALDSYHRARYVEVLARTLVHLNHG